MLLNMRAYNYYIALYSYDMHATQQAHYPVHYSYIASCISLSGNQQCRD